MTTERFIMSSPMLASADEVYRWHCRVGAFERLTPPWEMVQVTHRHGGIEDGGEVVLAVRTAGMWRRWVARHHDHVPGRQFCDTQVEGPFAHWVHWHRFVPDGPARSVLVDEVEYALPLGALGRCLAGTLVRRRLERLFRYRHAVTAQDLALHLAYPRDRALNILVSGSSGLVGSALVPFLTMGGHHVSRLVRTTVSTDQDTIVWNPEKAELDTARLEGLDVVVHLAGENIAARRWNNAHKARLRTSRVLGTRLLCDTLAKLRRRPRVLICASAIGYYGNRGDEVLTEQSASGDGFLADLCRDWEAAAEPAEAAGIRVVQLRFGIILSCRGGALRKMLLPLRYGLGGCLGSGRQWVSWIALDDVLGCIHHAIATDALHGPVNAVAPNPVTNRELTKTLGRVLCRPTPFSMPGFMARLAFGEMADELLLSSARVLPQALLASGYAFLYPHLEDALRHLLGQPGPFAASQRIPPDSFPHDHSMQEGAQP